MHRKTIGLRNETSFISLVALAFVGSLLTLLTACGGSSKPVSLAITASATTVDPTDSVTLTAAVTNDKNSDGVTWSVSGGGTLSSQTTSSVTYSAPSNPTSALTVTITATSVADTTKSATQTLTIPVAPSITTSSLAPGAVGTAYSATLAGSGGITPYTWSISSGTLPSGLSLATSTGVISGTPPAAGAGTANLTFKLTDSGTATALTATQTLSLTISPATAITFSTSTLAAATYNTAYSTTVSATGGAGALTFSVASGSLPTGLSMSTAGIISGTATAVGTYSFTVKATDAYGDAGTQAFSIKVSYPTLTVTTSSLAAASFNIAYSASLTATGGSGTGYTWAISGGSLPAGLTLSATGALSGTPTAVGTSTFAVKVTDSASNTATATLSITVSYTTLSVTSTAVSSGTVNTAYSATLAATGGSGTGYTWTVSSGSLPANLTLSTAGIISGTPTSSGTSTFTVKVTDSASNTATATLSITINASLAITSSSLPTATVGSSYSTTLTATGGVSPYTWSIATGSSAPSGLSLSSSGVLSGTPTTSSGGSPTTFMVKITDSASNTATATLSITINGALSITTGTTLPAGTVNTSYSQTLTATGGVSPYTWAVASGSSLPAGLSLSSAGVLSGSPTAGGTFSFTITATDSTSNTASATFSLIINAGLSITTTTLSSGTAGTAYSQTISVSGGIGPYTFSIISGSLPPWVSQSTFDSSGKITGTPSSSQTGSTTFTVEVTDSDSHTATEQLTLTIYSISGTNNSELKGQYAFLVKGWLDGTNNGDTTKSTVAGSFVADGNGNITSGELDSVNIYTSSIAAQSFTGTYALPSTNQGQMTLTIGSNTVTLAFSAGNISNGVSGGGTVIEFDDTNGIGATPGGSRVIGEFAMQTASDFTAASLTGGYAFGLEGETCPIYLFSGGPTPNSNCSATLSPGPLDIAGTMTFSGAGSISSAEEDIALYDGNCGGSGETFTCPVNYPQATFTGTYGTPDSFGRSTLTLTAPSSLASADQDIWPTDYAIYIINASKVYILSVDSHLDYALIVGEADQNAVSSFSSSTISGNLVVWLDQGNDESGWGTSNYAQTSDAIILRGVASGGSISGAIVESNQGTISTASGTLTYSVDSSGRATLTGLGSTPTYFYLYGTNAAFGVNTSGDPTLFHAENQTSTTLNNATLVGQSVCTTAQANQDTLIGTFNSGSLSILEAEADSDGTLTWDETGTATYTLDSTGLLTLSIGVEGYLVTPTRAIILQKGDGTSSCLFVLHQ